jgi:hypothetical protein
MGLIGFSSFQPTLAQPVSDVHSIVESVADSGGRASKLDVVIANLQKSAPQEESDQIVGAIRASSRLTRQLEWLASKGRLTAIRVVAGARALPVNGPPFGAAVDGTTMVFSSDFLSLARGTQPTPTGLGLDAATVNTVFALGDLGLLLESTDSPDGWSSSVADRSTYVHLAIERKAKALIEGWNDAADAVTGSRGEHTLGGAQIGVLLQTLRYRSSFTGTPVMFLSSGLIELTDSNLSAVVSTLSTSKIDDLE